MEKINQSSIYDNPEKKENFNLSPKEEMQQFAKEIVDPPSEAYKDLKIRHLSTVDVEKEKGTFKKIFVHPLFEIERIINSDAINKIKDRHDFENLLIDRYNLAIDKIPEYKGFDTESNRWEFLQVLERIEEYMDLAYNTDGKTILLLGGGDPEFDVSQKDLIFLLNIINPGDDFCFTETLYANQGILNPKEIPLISSLLVDKDILVGGCFAGLCATRAIGSLVLKTPKIHASAYKVDNSIHSQIGMPFKLNEITNKPQKQSSLTDIITSNQEIYRKLYLLGMENTFGNFKEDKKQLKRILDSLGKKLPNH